jgi:hypothetical protein
VILTIGRIHVAEAPGISFTVVIGLAEPELVALELHLTNVLLDDRALADVTVRYFDNRSLADQGRIAMANDAENRLIGDSGCRGYSRARIIEPYRTTARPTRSSMSAIFN